MKEKNTWYEDTATISLTISKNVPVISLKNLIVIIGNADGAHSNEVHKRVLETVNCRRNSRLKAG